MVRECIPALLHDAEAVCQMAVTGDLAVICY